MLVDDELIYAFYDAAAAAPTSRSGHDLRALVPRRGAKRQPRLLFLTRDELMRHEAAGITTQAFPPTIRLGGVDCAATYLHEPGDAQRRRDRHACRSSC